MLFDLFDLLKCFLRIKVAVVGGGLKGWRRCRFMGVAHKYLMNSNGDMLKVACF